MAGLDGQGTQHLGTMPDDSGAILAIASFRCRFGIGSALVAGTTW
jgi:hypothetical protein